MGWEKLEVGALTLRRRKELYAWNQTVTNYLLSSVWRPVALAFADNCGTQAAAKIVWQFVKMGLPVNLDGHLGRVADHVTVMAPLKMIFQLGFGLGIHRPVEVIR